MARLPVLDCLLRPASFETWRKSLLDGHWMSSGPKAWSVIVLRHTLRRRPHDILRTARRCLVALFTLISSLHKCESSEQSEAVSLGPMTNSLCYDWNLFKMRRSLCLSLIHI